MVFKYFLVGGRVEGWLEKWGLKLISTQVVVEVEVGVELGKSVNCVSRQFQRKSFNVFQ